MATAETINDVDTVTKVVVRPPRKFAVVIYNDDKTAMEFVILVLMQIFHKSFEEASTLTILIHEVGHGIAGTYSQEVANQKREDTINSARINGYPLHCEIKPI